MKIAQFNECPLHHSAGQSIKKFVSKDTGGDVNRQKQKDLETNKKSITKGASWSAVD